MNDPLSEWLGLQPKWTVPFPDSHFSLAKPVNQPVVYDQEAMVVFGDSSAIYAAKITDPGQRALTPIPAGTIIHGWTIDDGNLYFVDGVDLIEWNLGDFTKRHSLQLVDDASVATARAALGELTKALQSVEWATFLEQAEDEWERLTTQQAATPSPSDERDRLDALAADYFGMLRALRKMVGTTGGGAAARQKVAALRAILADKRKAAAPWCFSAPVVRRHGFEEGTSSVFTMQGNGTLHGCDKQLSSASHKRKNWQKDQVELQIAFLDEQTSAPKLVAYVSGSTLYVVDAKTLDEKSHWSPPTVPAVNTTHSLVAANGQFWWSTDSGVYACKPDDQSHLQPTWHSGAPWTTRQVGRLDVPETNYKTPVDPNDLFESMNVHAWIGQRADRSAPLNDGMTAQLMLSDENGRYVAPPPGTTHLLYGPFSHDTASAGSWGEIKPHPTNPLVLLSDSNKCNMLCRYPTPTGISQLLPQWSVTPFYVVTKGSAADVALAQRWPAPVRPLSKPHPDMIDFLHKSTAKDAIEQIETVLPIMTSPRRQVSDREVRFVLWHGLLNHKYPDQWFFKNDGSAKRAFDVVYTDAQGKVIRDQFPGLGTTWDFRTGDAHDTTYNGSFFGKLPVDFDPPYAWKTPPPQALFHRSPPAWYDPWGYNRPGDFVPQQPPASYLDPFCFNGQLGFPQRPITLENKFRGRQWAVFTDNDAASMQASGTTASADAAIPTDPCVLVVNTNDDKQQTTLYVLAPKHLNVTYDAPSHEIHPETLPFAFLSEHVLACPAVFFDAAKIYPAAWCPGSKEYPSTRLRKIASVDQAKGKSLWDTFVDKNKAQYGPSGGDTAWKIDVCPLPADVLPATVLYGYLLPAPH